jgi:L-fucose mutarotase
VLKGISPLISSDLLVTLHRMGHGDRIVLADAFFPAYRFGVPVVAASGLKTTDLLAAILPLFTLDQYTDAPLTMMQAVPGDELDPKVVSSYETIVRRSQPDRARIRYVERFAFYEEAATSFAIVLTGSVVKYANLMLTKGVTPILEG